MKKTSPRFYSSKGTILPNLQTVKSQITNKEKIIIIQSTYKQSLCYVITACHADRLILMMKFRTENVSAAGTVESAVDQPTCWSSAQRAERFQSVPQALETTVRLGEVS